MGGKQTKPYYRLDSKTVLEELETKREGLSESAVQQQLQEFGPNELQKTHRESYVYRFLKQFKDLLILLLVFSTILAFMLGDNSTGIVLTGLVLFNTLLGFIQEFKAERLMDSLERLVGQQARVIREGQQHQISGRFLVPGDIVYVEEGESVPADIRLISEAELATNDFALTGESQPSRKFTHAIANDVELANRHNLAFMGTTVAGGHAYGVVIATGMNTELGRIASLSADMPSDYSPLQRELNHIAKRITQGIIVLALLLLPVMIYAGMGIQGSLLFSVVIAASLIPQGLLAEINSTLAQSANRLAKAKALVKRLSAVETLGATHIILTDKTGTLTKNEMTVQQLLIGRSAYTVTGTGYENNGHIANDDGKKLSSNDLKNLELFFTTGVLASNARISPPDNEHATWYCIGDPTEGALLTLATKAGLTPQAIDEHTPELKEFAFDSARKRMSSVRKFGPHGQLFVFVKGAPENVIERCTDIWDHGHIRKLASKDTSLYESQHQEWAEDAMRNLAYAYKILPADTDVKKLDMEELESDLTLLGMVSMVDPLREEVASAMTAAHAAHLKVSIITGDFATTAMAIASKAGLAEHKDTLIVVSGEELRKMDDAQVVRLVARGGTIFSRVSPEDKLRVVSLAKHQGFVVAVTGDGINDAPALKRADIGVAMGLTGTDVAKQSAEIVLLDDSFKTLIQAVQQGRVIFQNIRKATLSCFTSNSAELVVCLVSLAALSLFGVPIALSVMQILAIDMVAELFPIAALGWDKADSEVMTEQPRNPRDHILNARSILDLAWCGILIGGLAFTNYILFFWRNDLSAVGANLSSPELYLKATSITYLTIVLCQLLNILQRRSQHGLFTRYQLHNRQLWFAILISLLAVSTIIHHPTIAPYFGSGSLSLIDWGYALGAAALFVGIRELQRHSNKHHTRDTILELLQANAS